MAGPPDRAAVHSPGQAWPPPSTDPDDLFATRRPCRRRRSGSDPEQPPRRTVPGLGPGLPNLPDRTRGRVSFDVQTQVTEAMKPPVERSPRYLSLDVWRGLACLMVVVHHAAVAV